MARKLIQFISVASMSQDMRQANLFRAEGIVSVEDAAPVGVRNIWQIGQNYYTPKSIERAGPVSNRQVPVVLTCYRSD